MSKRIKFLVPLFVMAAVLLMATAATPAHAQTATPPPAPTAVPPTGCVDGADAVTGDPCLQVATDTVMTEIFKWANTAILILLPLIAIVIGLTFGSNVLSGIKNIFGNIKVG